MYSYRCIRERFEKLYIKVLTVVSYGWWNYRWFLVSIYIAFLPVISPSFIQWLYIIFYIRKVWGKKQLKSFLKSQLLMPGWRGKQEPWSPHGPWEWPDFWASSKQGAPGPATLTERRQRRSPEQEDLSTEQERHSLMFWGTFSVPTGQRTPNVGGATEEYGLWPQSQHPSAAL